jgi:Homeobox KN domain
VAKRLKMCQEEPDSMLLDRLEDMEKSHLEVFEEAVDGLTHNLLSSIAGCPGQWVLPPPECGKSSFDMATLPSSDLLQESEPVASLSSNKRNRHDAEQPTDKSLFFEKAKIKLQKWLDMNSKNPYPTNQEKLRLMKETGLRRSKFGCLSCRVVCDLIVCYTRAIERMVYSR